MTRDLIGRRLLITGASSGIGWSLAEQAALEGALVAVTARSADRLEELVQLLRTRHADAIAIPGDITLEEDRTRILQGVLDHFGGLDILVNNAGLGSWGHFADSSEDVLRTIMEVNFFAPAEMVRQALPLLKQGRQPAIVNVASRCGRRGLPAWTEYSASKFALCGLTEALRGEMARFDIDVLLIVPGFTQSGMFRHMLRKDGRERINLNKGMPPARVAAAVLNAIQKNRAETTVGMDARWILLANRFFPRILDRLIAGRVTHLYQEPTLSASPE